MEHKLKTWPVFFADVESGVKTFEIRKNDRNFQVGDILILEEYDPWELTEECQVGKYTGHKLRVIVNYTIRLNRIPGISDGFIGMGIEIMEGK